MKLIRSSQQKIFIYDNGEERLSHIKEMEQDGWSCSGKVKTFTGRFMVDEDVINEDKYIYVGEFYREETE